MEDYKTKSRVMEEEEAQATVMGEHALQPPHLPHYLVVDHILTRLPIKSLINFKFVSKLWYSTLSSSQFAYTHLKLSSFYHPIPQNQFLFIQNKENYHLLSYNDDDCDYDDEMGSNVDGRNMNLVKLRFNFNEEDLVLIGSCNGLVCLASFSGFLFILWNPITGKFCKYSDPDFVIVVDSSSNYRVSWGFGYVSSIDDYKVVRIVELNNTLEIRVHVFSLKLDKWGRIDDGLFGDIVSLATSEQLAMVYNEYEPQSRYPHAFHSRQGVLVNETLYWIVSNTNDWGRKIVAFDLALETFDTIVDLNLVSNDVYRDKLLCDMGGCLSKCGVNKFDDVFIAMLKGPGEVENLCLSRKWGLRSCRGIVKFTKRGKFFILMEDSTIGIVDPTSQPMKYTPLVTLESLGKTRVSSYVPSLISPYTNA